MVELASAHGKGRKSGADETAFLPTAVNSDQKRGSLQLNDYESEKLNTHLSSLFDAGSIQFQCTFLRLDKPILDLLKPDETAREKQGPPAKISADMKALYAIITELESSITTRMGTLADDEWPPTVTHTEYAKYKLAIGQREVPRSLQEIKNNLRNYASPHLATADIMTFFECDFLYLTPGSERYANRVKASREFLQKMDEYVDQQSRTKTPLDMPLMNDAIRRGAAREAGTSAGAGAAGRAKARTNAAAKKRGSLTKDVSGKSGMKRGMKTTSGSRTSKMTGRVGDGNKRTSGNAKRGGMTQEDDLCNEDEEYLDEYPDYIQKDEYEIMSALLGRLTEADHMGLYERYKTTARWTILDDIVELDDKNTSPQVFRDMMSWCEAQLEKR